MGDRDELAARIRDIVMLDPGVTEKKMFGGLGYSVNGNMILGVTGKGELMARFGRDNEAVARALPGAENIDFEAKRMGGFLIIGGDAIEEEEQLQGWIDLCLAYARTLPPK
jgi:TfoX N-terminal domain